nr:hypothetical protein [Tanacetum cinerariifolium]
MNFDTRSSQVKIDRGGSLSSQILASPSNEKENSNNLTVVLGTSECRNVDVTLLKKRRWLCGSCLPERLINLVENDNSDSSNDPLLEEVDLFLSDDSIPPGIENFTDDPEGDIRFLEELLINDSILSHESFDSSFEDNLSISRPPPEPPDDNFDLEPEVISTVMEDIDEPDEHFNPGGEIFVSTNNEDRVRT